MHLIGPFLFWSGFVRSGSGVWRSVLALPFLLLVEKRPVIILAIHFRAFASYFRAGLHWARSEKDQTASHPRRRSEGEGPQRRAAATLHGVTWKKPSASWLCPNWLAYFGLLTLRATSSQAMHFCHPSPYSLCLIFSITRFTPTKQFPRTPSSLFARRLRAAPP